MDDQAIAAISSKAKLAEARHAAKTLLKTAGVKAGPVRLNDIIKHVPVSYHLVVRGTTQLPPGLDAFTYRDNEITIIGYHQSVAPVRQKFSVAHELGHLYMGHVHGQTSLDLDSPDNDEMEANQFAAHLVMPPLMLRADIKKGLKDMKLLAGQYGVSEEAMWWQLAKCGLVALL
jgi:Zn-dependent peptidase ImmA (M78 family)